MTPPPHLPLPSRASRIVRTLVVSGVTVSVALLGACSNDKPTDKNTASPSPAAGASASPSGTASPSPSAAPTVKPSTNLDALKVSGVYGKPPELSFEHPWAIDRTQSKVLKHGNGAQVQADGTVAVNYTGWIGRTGKKFDSSYEKSFQHQQTAYFPLSGVVPGFKKGLQGKHAGDRVLIAMTGKDGYDSSGGNAQAGIKVGDTLIFVVDIQATTLKSAEGKEVKPPAGLPSVRMSGDKPMVSIPKSDPPEKTTVQPLIKGDGAKVAATDNVTTRSVTVLWKNGKVVDDAWGTPFAPQTDPSTGQTSPVRLKAMQQAMVGQTVGSRLLIVFPAGEGYPNGDRSQGIGKDDTVVMVVDILFSQPAQ